MELFKYIIKFIYRIRWWMVIFPCIRRYHSVVPYQKSGKNV